jgi:hypothetical protein
MPLSLTAGRRDSGLQPSVPLDFPVEPGLVAPAQWRPGLHNPLVDPRAGDDGHEPALKAAVFGHPGDHEGAAWHLCGIGIKD